MSKTPLQEKKFNDLMDKCRVFLDQHPQEQDEVALGILMNSLAGRDVTEAMKVMSMLLAQFCMATANTFEADVRSVLLGVMADTTEQINVMEGAEQDEEDVEEAEAALREYQASEQPKGTIH